MRDEGKSRRRLVLENQTCRLGRRLVALRRRSRRLSHLRLGLFLLGAVISAATLLSAGVQQWLGVSVGVAAPFFAAVYAHRRVEEIIRCYEIWLDFKETHIARMDLAWERLPAALPVPPRLDHPFALDLDLIGERSLHRLLDTAVSQEGSLRLRDWLLKEEPDLDRMLERQALVKELVHRPVFRDKLRLHAALAWALYAAVSAAQLRRIGPVFHEAFFLRDGLEQLGAVFDFMERNRYGRALNLRKLCAPFVREGERPSQHLKRVRRVVAAISLQKTPILWFQLNALIPWDIYFARRLNQSKQALADLLPAWLNVWFELEALNSLILPDCQSPLSRGKHSNLLP